MPSDCISYQSSGYFTPLIVDYLNQKENLKPLYHRFPTLENFKNQLEEKQQSYPASFRSVLVNVLLEQYKNSETSAVTLQNIQLLTEDTTFTITTGHQLNLFTGPLYFLYKIVSTINLSRELKSAYPNHNFVPVYWMATEDHDFEEINYFNFHSKKIKWHSESAGPVGRLSTKGLDTVLDVFSKELGAGNTAETLKSLFKTAYLNHDNLADATRYLANELFGKEGLVIIDADNADLKKLFVPHIKKELLHQTSHSKVAETTEKLSEYNIQVNPREINLFYIENNLRERIILQDGIYYINNTDLQFTESEMLEVLEKYPEKFSPNVIMRPLYQEVILPNLCYIGGGGELAYWLELKTFFEASAIPFPILLLRNSVLLATQKQADKLDKLNLSWADVFMKQQKLMNNKIQHFSKFQLDFTEQKEFLKQQFKKLNEIASKTDTTFAGAVKAQEAKQLKGLDNLEKRLLKAEKRNHANALGRIAAIQNELFPSQSLQERKANFAEFYLDYDKQLIDKLLQQLKPLEQEFSIIVL
ncbi:bacillithiol biosynthesis cysteine-adding enzyme BshC [Flavobacterium salilacus subsp. salilacus]|uniref:bacillithiol biosynthesis cysteine-adding enzyme BshC n=1 Tax=Flavobacterium TaxID=237 RepID=UPI001074B096|nr:MULTISPECIES: bacillithiol biosynthesis cysteine-adding enzyme BshC [Flavobacterium]KAF2519414.1 bacillithiol biosynthesis cysteine-adding enzyme BshC [Flavobacterium salilacus subsp. salilacus]MBE1614694.1 bacillithiol biosynthesis cysteine-adding enzyme BshC [Flavobacterium sp. SaA2.13]